MNASKNKARLVLLTTFALGALTGALAMNLIPSRAGSRDRSMVDELQAEARLDARQRQQVEQVLADTNAKYEELRQQMHPRFAEIREASRARIRALLTPEQQPLYDEWNRKRDSKRSQKHKGERHPERPGPPPGPSAGGR